MEARTILIANTKTQKRYSIQTSATTLGELQDQLDAQGIDYRDMSFTEGITKTQLTDRSTLLPTNVMYKGAPTNNLVMLLTNTNKQIASGASIRPKLYDYIKSHGLQDYIKDASGRNFTQVSSNDLIDYINNSPMIIHTGFAINPETGEEELIKPDDSSDCGTPVEPAKEEVSTDEEESAEVKDMSPAGLLVLSVIGYLTCGNQLCITDLQNIKDNIDKFIDTLQEKAVTFSDKDIDDMINSL